MSYSFMSEQGFKIQILNFLLWPHNVLTEALVILFREEEMVCFKIKGQFNLILLFSNFEKKQVFFEISQSNSIIMLLSHFVKGNV